MRNIWRAKLGKEVGTKAFGCLVGLAKEWGGHAVDIFKAVLNNWPAFMVGMKQHPDCTTPRFYKFPSITVIRRFPDVAAEVWMMDVQKAGDLKAGQTALALVGSYETATM
jgi:hypothetical protein